MTRPKTARTVLAALALVASAWSYQAPAPRVELLWPEGAPGAVASEEADRPTLALYLPPPAAAVGTAVVICPGGGYGSLALDHEGRQIAEWLNGLGIAGCVLRYRLGPRYRHPAPLQDAARALRYVRSHAAELAVAPDRIGIWGFSAGGHLAATAATHFDAGDPQARDAIERASSRPDFLILAYPVITFTAEYTHRGSRRNLLGDDPEPKLVESLSNERQVTPQTPPTFLFHTDSDAGVPPENSVAFYLALRKAGVPAELHIYERGKWRRPGAVGPGAFDLGPAPGGLAEGERAAGTSAPRWRKLQTWGLNMARITELHCNGREVKMPGMGAEPETKPARRPARRSRSHGDQVRLR